MISSPVTARRVSLAMSCPICHDTHWKSIDVNGVEQVVRCDCWRGDLVKRLMADARIPPRFSRAELDTFEHDMDTQRAAWRKATAFVEAFPVVDRGLLFYGPHGVGKTHLAVGILKACIREQGRARVFSSKRASCCGWCATPTTARSKRPRWKCCSRCSAPTCSCSTTSARSARRNGCRKRWGSW